MFGNMSDNLGARGRKRSRKKSRGGCAVKTITIKTRGGKVVRFRGKSGPGCGPRKKPSTRHLAPYKRAMASAARSCQGLKKRQFESCVASAMRSGGGKRRRRRK